MVREEDNFKTLVREFLEGLGFELPEEPVIDARRFRRLPPPSTPHEERLRTTIKVTRYTLHQIRKRCPPAMTTDMFLRLLLFLYDVVKNKGVILDLSVIPKEFNRTPD